MSELHLPVRPDLGQLRLQAKDFHRALRAHQADAVVALVRHHPTPPDPAAAKRSDAQLVLARRYGVASWPRLVRACRLIDAIWTGDLPAVRALVTRHPELLRENARGTERCNWGPPLSYAANVGQDEIVRMLHQRGADDIQHAFERACLRSKIDTARVLLGLGATLRPGMVMGPCETLSATGLALQLELGAALVDESGDPRAPLGLVLETYSRNPDGKHGCLELLAAHGIDLPDTPVMALHRGRLDLLEAHLRRDPGLLSRRFPHEEIYPQALGCHADPTLALNGTPIAGGTLLHLAVDFDETEIAIWLLANGAPVDARATVDADGFGGHTALFGCVVSQPYRNGRDRDGAMARLLLAHGAHTGVRASLRKALRGVADASWHAYHEVTPAEWGRRFHDQDWVNPVVLALLEPSPS
jgi:hypothetical protein